jgi:hypothetical protein
VKSDKDLAGALIDLPDPYKHDELFGEITGNSEYSCFTTRRCPDWLSVGP